MAKWWNSLIKCYLCHKRLADARVPHDKTITQQQIAVTDQQIDRLVYELYGLTEKEIKMVEGK